MPEKERLAKRIAAAGLCSRRVAEQWITDGRVAVNGRVVAIPAPLVSASDNVTVDGRPLPPAATQRVFRFHKPVGVLCTERDPQGRPVVQDLLPAGMRRLITVGRLDLNSEGLLLLTTDGTLAQAWMRGNWPRVYRVRVRGHLSDKGLARLRKGPKVAGVRYAPIGIEAEATGKPGRNQWYRVTLTEGKNREIRKVIEAIDGQVNRLIRIAYGPFELGTLARGDIAEVRAAEIEACPNP
jgi:23S rRNA pseudouridine2605 synthase